MPSRRHSAAMLSSPRKPSSTMRILSSAEWCLRVARRISRTTRSAGDFGTAWLGDGAEDFWLIFTPPRLRDAPDILTRPLCPIGADAGHPREVKDRESWYESHPSGKGNAW